MIESVKPVGKAEYAAGTKNVLDAGVEAQKEEDVSYVVDLRSANTTEGGGKKLSADQIDKIKKQVEAQNESLRQLVEKLLTKQDGIYKAFKGIELDLDMTPKEAQQAISEDGEWGVNAVSDRIVAFAIAISGNDTSKLDELKAAIDKGFKLAGRSLGRELPDICNQTYDAVMKKLDDWAKTGGVDVEA